MQITHSLPLFESNLERPPDSCFDQVAEFNKRALRPHRETHKASPQTPFLKVRPTLRGEFSCRWAATCCEICWYIFLEWSQFPVYQAGTRDASRHVPLGRGRCGSALWATSGQTNLRNRAEDLMKDVSPFQAVLVASVPPDFCNSAGHLPAWRPGCGTRLQHNHS